MEFNNILCKIFGHKYRCRMACMSVCSRCNDVYEYNVTDCGICGGRRLLVYKKGYGQLLLCEKGCYSKKYWKAHKMSNREYEKRIQDDYESNGLIHNFFHKKQNKVKNDAVHAIGDDGGKNGNN